jgi:hypothetical protein
LCGSGGCTRRLCTAPPTQIISDGARGVLAEREMRVECLLAEQGVHFGSPNACCARRCAKTGPGVGLRWPEKVVGHLPRGALSGARGVPPQRGVFWGRCAGIRACRGKYIQYIQIQIRYTHDTYNTYRYQRIHTHTYTYIHQAIRVWRCFCAAVAAPRDASAQRHLPRSSPTGLGACSPSAKCVWTAYWLSRGCTLDPPTRAARAGAPKRVRGWVSDGRKKWSATCPGVP